jgi:hypothetical protein
MNHEGEEIRGRDIDRLWGQITLATEGEWIDERDQRDCLAVLWGGFVEMTKNRRLRHAEK